MSYRKKKKAKQGIRAEYMNPSFPVSNQRMDGCYFLNILNDCFQLLKSQSPFQIIGHW